MQNLPIYISALLVLATLFSIIMFVKAANGNRTVLYSILVWITIQGLLAFTRFYTNTAGIPPRFALAILPAFTVVILLFVSARGRHVLDRLDLQTLTLLHFVRVPVEMVLLWLFINKAIPQVMTFEGNNPDILSGISAPIIWYLTRNNSNGKLLLAWNFVCLGLLLNIVITAVLAAPFKFQQIAFDQPNIALLYFPYVWLPSCIVPLVLLSHLTAIRQLLKQRAVSFT